MPPWGRGEHSRRQGTDRGAFCRRRVPARPGECEHVSWASGSAAILAGFFGVQMALEVVPCLVCGDSAQAPVCRKFNLEIVRCKRCGFVYASPRLTKDDLWTRYSSTYFWDEYLPSYGVQDGKFDLRDFDIRYHAMLEMVATRVSPPGDLLEIGAGAGFFLKAAERAGWRVAGTEILEAAIGFAGSRLGLEIRQEAAEQLGAPDDSADVVAMFEVIEHLLDPRVVLERLRGVLRPGGLLVLSTPNFNSLSRIALGDGWAVLSPAEHVYYFTKGSLRQVLTRAGFSDVEFIRRHGGQGLFETMNPRHTHTPEKMRTAVYRSFVEYLGPALVGRVQSWGLGDTLFCFARSR
ncbi:MAG: class I SAM-dependent methyltransferase [Acidobacteria bacterium]|nr:MAG: class I SAM-dependent methyltransferase [Acidobacteriota bacterium]